jgi:DeoR/GlpR family transcriptional regulator of sugar metabolism
MADRVKTGELAKVLGISRQRVNELSRKGKLTRSADGKWDPDRARSELKRTPGRAAGTAVESGNPPVKSGKGLSTPRA